MQPVRPWRRLFPLQLCFASAFLLTSVGARLWSADGAKGPPIEATLNFWDGGDVGDDWSAIPEVYNPRFTIRRPYASEEAPSVEILGLPESGTSLLQQVLWFNFPNIKFYAQFPASVNATEEKIMRLSQKGIWKHANLWLANDHIRPRIRKSFEDNKVVMLAVVREPLAWLRAIHKEPHNLQGCVTGDDWLDRPCIHPNPTGHAGVDHDLPHNVSYSSLMAIWNKWSMAYETAWSRMFSRAIIVRYEDLVLEPESAIREIARQLNVSQPTSFWVPSETKMSDGHSNVRSEAVERIKKKVHLWQYTGSDLRSACTGLEAQLMARFGYDDCKRIVEEANRMAKVAGRSPH